MTDALQDLLRCGGYILYSRHGEATIGKDLPNLNFNCCNTQRTLSNIGRKQAIKYGGKLRCLRIPISCPIIASPFCRTVETAALAFNRRNVKIDPFWYDVFRFNNLSSSEQNEVLENVRSRLERIPPKGKNQVIIAHGFPKGIGLGEIENMGTIIVKPLGEGNGYEMVDKL